MQTEPCFFVVNPKERRGWPGRWSIRRSILRQSFFSRSGASSVFCGKAWPIRPRIAIPWRPVTRIIVSSLRDVDQREPTAVLDWLIAFCLSPSAGPARFQERRYSTEKQAVVVVSRSSAQPRELVRPDNWLPTSAAATDAASARRLATICHHAAAAAP